MKNQNYTIVKQGKLYFIMDENNLPVRKVNYKIPTNQHTDRWNDLTFTSKREAVIYCKIQSNLKK